ncbi:MAG: glycosyltransferase [Planctomycetota bacterium]
MKPGSSPEDRWPVLHVRVVANAGGGPDKTILRSPAHAPARYPMAAAYLHPAGCAEIDTLAERAAEHRCAFHAIPEHGPLDPIAVARLLGLCRRLGVRIWHAHDYKTNLLGRVVRRFHPMQLVSTMHGFTGETTRVRLYDKLDRWTLPRYDAVAAVSDRLYEQALRFGIGRDKLALIPNGVDIDDYQRTMTREQARLSIGLSPDRPVVVVLGRLSPEKGQDRAIQALAQLDVEHRQTELVLVGDGPCRVSLEQQARALGVAERVRFAGWSADPRPYLQAADLLLLPSRTEGLPNAVLEAMATGLAVAAAPVGATPEALDHGRAGCVLDQDPVGWPAALSMLLSNDDRRARLAGAGQARARRFYGFDLRMHRMIDLYDRVTGATPEQASLQSTQAGDAAARPAGCAVADQSDTPLRRAA